MNSKFLFYGELETRVKQNLVFFFMINSVARCCVAGWINLKVTKAKVLLSVKANIFILVIG